MQKHIVLLLLLAFSVLTNAQVSHGGKPIDASSEIEVQNLPLSVKPGIMASGIATNSHLPLRFAEPIYTNFTTDNSGTWETTEDGVNVWRLAIKSEGAKSLNLIFDIFCLKNVDRLFVYNTERTQVLGGFTKNNNNPSKLFAVAPIAGDEIVVEFQTKSAIGANHEIKISAVNHDFLGVGNELKNWDRFNWSCDEHVNVVCGSINTDEINRSVCKIIVDGTELCTGTMVNNSNEDGRPYFLSAAHCFDNPKDGAGELTAQNVVFYFNLESSTCDPSTKGTELQTLSGAQLKAYVKDMDFALLEMDKIPPQEYNPYWAGWSREENISGPVYTVHHPFGDIKKVSTSNNAPVNATYPSGIFRNEVHWHVSTWISGTTEGGSSGGGLFSKDHQLIGTLSGGEAGCNNPVNDYFARFNTAWSTNSSSDEQLAYWLDPKGTNPMNSAGYDYYVETSVPNLPNNEALYVKILNNPVRNGLIRFTTNLDKVYSVEIFAVNGAKVLQVSTTDLTDGRISINGLPVGLYLVKFSSQQGALVKRVVVAI